MHMPVLVRGGYGHSNFGDDLLFRVVHRFVRQHFAADEVGYLCEPASYLDSIVGEPVHCLQVFDPDPLTTDLLIFGGGTQFYSFAGLGRGSTLRRVLSACVRPSRLVASIRFRLTQRAKSLPDQSAARIGLGLGFGPFQPGSSAQELAGIQARSLDLAFVRDHRSHAFCASCDANPILAADLCYFDPIRGIDRSTDDGQIGVVVRDWPHDEQGRAYNDALRVAVDRLREQGNTVRFILFAPGDREWRDRLERWGEDTLIWNPETMTIESFVDELSACAALITARFHGAIIGSMLKVPLVCIDIEPKLSTVANDLDAALWTDGFDPAALVDLVATVRREREARRTSMTAIVNEQHERARNMFQLVEAFLEKTGTPTPAGP